MVGRESRPACAHAARLVLGAFVLAAFAGCSGEAAPARNGPDADTVAGDVALPPGSVDDRGPAVAFDSALHPYARRVVVFVMASAAELEALRGTVSEEDFAVIADDAMYYRANAYEFLEQHGFPVVSLEGRRPLAFRVGTATRRYDFADVRWLDFVVLYDPVREPRVLATNEIETALEYFHAGAFPSALPRP